MKRLSVCIVAYNDYDDIDKAVETLEQYTIVDHDIYIVDNSSSDYRRCNNNSDIFSKFSSVQILNPGYNLGFGKGHNYVLDRLDSEYHCIMNPDILFNSDAFTPIVSYLDENPDVGMVIPNIIDEKGERQLVYRKDPTVFDMFIRMFCKGLFPRRIKEHTLQSEDYSKPFQVPFGQGSFLVIRTKLLKDLDGFDDGFFMYLEDADLCRRVNQVSKLMYIPDATVIHKWEKGSHKNGKLFRQHLKSMRYYFHKWGVQWR